MKKEPNDMITNICDNSINFKKSILVPEESKCILKVEMAMECGGQSQPDHELRSQLETGFLSPKFCPK